MQKDFEGWNLHKKAIDASNAEGVDCHEREIWWCSIGVNIGREQQSQTRDFSRPVLIVKKFTRDIFLAIPLTTKIKDYDFRFRLRVSGIENDALLLHMRSFDRKRLVRKIGMLSKDEFGKLTGTTADFLNCRKKRNPPFGGNLGGRSQCVRT